MKEFELEKNSRKEVLTDKEVYDLLLPATFTSMLMRLNVNESMFHYDTLTNYKRIK